jgi:RimJ/RimL family protein N-acetyltransferase
MPPTIIDIPILSTPRLVLRGHKLEDFETTVAIWTDPVVRRHFHGPAMTREDLWARFLRQFGMWAVMGYGSWAVEEKETGDYIGTVGVFEVKRDIEPSLDGVPEAGWTLAARVHGKGYATEAAQAALAWADAHLNRPRMCCIIAPANTSSVRVAEKCGFRFWQETVYKDAPTLILTREPK